MGMSGSALADAIRSAMGFPLPVSNQLLGWGNAIVAHIQTGTVSNASGTVTGTVPPTGGPLIAGAADNGVIAGLNGSTLASLIFSDVAVYPGSVTAQLLATATSIVSHVLTGKVKFNSGNITGVCTNTPLPSPGILTGGAGSNGVIYNLSGSTLASLIHSSVGYPGSVSAKLIQFSTAIVNYVMANAVVTYAPGSVTGVCPSGGGSLSGGAASGGTIA